MADTLKPGSVADKTVDPSNARKNDQLLQPNAKDDPECISGDNPQKPWTGGSGKPKGPFGQQGKNF